MGRLDYERELAMPFGGVSDDLGFAKQGPATCREAANVRGQDPEEERQRISQRAGLSKANSAQMDAAGRIIEMASVVYDARALEYSFTAGQESTEWSAEVPSNSSVYHGVCDAQGNVYVTDGPTSVVKLNSDGARVWQFPLPMPDPGHAIRFVYVDDLFDVYVGVSSGTRQDLGRLWKLTQLPEDEVEIGWEVELGAFVELAKVQRDKLYTIQNEPETKRAFVRIYSQLDALLPKLAQEWEVPYPAHGMDVNAAGAVFVASGPDGDILGTSVSGTDAALTLQRGPNPRQPRFAPQTVNWTPYDLENYSRRIWSWFEAEDIGEFDVIGERETGARLRRWPDRSGNDRHLYPASSRGFKAPTLELNARGRYPAVRFNGVDEALISGSNSSTSKSAADEQKTVLPAYEGSMFCTIAVVQPEKRSTGNPMWIFGQDNSAAGALDHILIANRAAGSTLPGALSSGDICHYSATDGTGDGGAGTNGHPEEGSFDNFNDYAIVVILWDGGIEPNDSSSAVTRSLFQVNGLPIDRYEGLGNTTTEPTIVGWWSNPSSGFDPFKGRWLAWITLDRTNREDDATEPKVLTHDAREAGDTTDQTDNELTRLVGYFAHKFGLQHLLPKQTAAMSHPYGAKSATIEALSIVDTLAGPPDDSNPHLGPHARVGRAFPCLSKYDPQGNLVWVANGEEDDPLVSGTDAAMGFGYGVVVDPDGNLFSIGPSSGPWITKSTNYLRKVIDQGDDFSLAAVDNAWGVNIGDPGYAWPRLAVDPAGNVYVPLAQGASNYLRVYRGTDGTLISDTDVGVPARQLYAVAIDPNVPDYQGDLTDEIARFVYVFGLAGSDPALPVYKVRLVQESPLTGSPRQHVHLAVSSTGLIRTFDVGGSSFSTPTGASGALTSTPSYVQAVAAFDKVYLTDGVSKIQVFSPRENTIAQLDSTTPGEPPHGARILEFWAGRLVGLRAPGLINGAYNWLMSRKGVPTDFNAFPVERDSAAAIGGSNVGGPGLVPDLPNCFIPYNDDIAFVGCDHAIYQLTGDPGEGGVWDLVSDITGMAFGRPWSKDPEGNLWFIGSRGGLFIMRPGARPVRVSETNIDRRLSRINFGTHYVRLAWNDRDKGMHILVFPFGTPGAPVEHYFWDAKRGAPWPDTFGTSEDPSVEPTAVHVVDADDPDDRVVLLGGRDGYIRKWDVAAKDDDGVPIDAHVLLGPMGAEGSRTELRFTGPRAVLASDQDGATYQLYASADPVVIGAPRAVGQLNPGRNPLRRARVRGSYCYLRLRNSVAGQRFAVEEVAIRAHPAGLKRVRTTP